MRVRVRVRIKGIECLHIGAIEADERHLEAGEGEGEGEGVCLHIGAIEAY